MRLVTVTKAAAASVCGALVLASAGSAAAQPDVERAPAASVSISRALFTQDSFIQFRDDGWGREVIRVGQTYELKQGETVYDVVSVFGPATINGNVRGDVTVALGTVTIGPSAVIEGSLVAVGGNVTIQDGAAIQTDMIVVGGGVNAPANFTPGRQHVAIGGTAIANRLNSAVPWLTEGLLLGRPLVPRLSWVWMIVGVTLVVSLLLALIFADSVRACANAIAARPFTTFVVGLLVLVLTGPVTIMLVASVVGILVVPFALCALVIAWMIGKVGVTIRLGDVMSGQTSPPSRVLTIRSLLLGFAAIMLIYMVPVLGLLAWSVVGVTGLGAATLAFSSAYRRENPARPRPPKPAPTAPAAGLDSGTAPAAFTPPIAPPVATFDASGAAAVAETPAVATTTNLLAFPKAGFAERAAAFALDTIFVLIICGALGVFEHDDEGVVVLALLAYHIGFWAWKGTTFGGIVCQLRVIRFDGSPLRFVDALVRGIAGIFSLAVLGLGCLWIVRDEERQSWHDKIAGTYVVNVPRNWPV
jgi:uncharacterized RDD family membrane protein YckC